MGRVLPAHREVSRSVSEKVADGVPTNPGLFAREVAAHLECRSRISFRSGRHLTPDALVPVSPQVIMVEAGGGQEK